MVNVAHMSFSAGLWVSACLHTCVALIIETRALGVLTVRTSKAIFANANFIHSLRFDVKGCQDINCPVGMFKCRNGPCINESLLCNGQIDCPDVWTDEHNCTYGCHDGCSCRDSTLNCSGCTKSFELKFN